MALDAAKMAAMRGEPDGDEAAPEGGEESSAGPSEDELSAARRFRAAMKQGDDAALVAAIKDICGY